MTYSILHQVVTTSPLIFFIYYHLMEMTYWTAPYLYILSHSITEFSIMWKLVTFIKVPKSKWSVSTDWVCWEEWTPKGIKTQKVDRGCVPAQTPPAISYSSTNISVKQYYSIKKMEPICILYCKAGYVINSAAYLIRRTSIRP